MDMDMDRAEWKLIVMIIKIVEIIQIMIIKIVADDQTQIRPVSYHFLDVLFKKLWVIRLLSYLVRAIENILNLGDSEYLEKQ